MIPNTYDAEIQIAALRFLPEFDWLECKAEWWVESRLKPDAKSPADALGLTQCELETFNECGDHLGFPSTASPFDPHYSIQAGTYYLSKMFRAWKPDGRTLEDRKRLARAAYNAGLGSILRAQHLANGAMDYDTIIAQLPRVTGQSNARETTGYVVAIETAYRSLTNSTN